MAYDGFYSGLSSAGTVNEVLNQAIQTKNEIAGLVVEAQDAEAAAELAADRAEAAADGTFTFNKIVAKESGPFDFFSQSGASDILMVGDSNSAGAGQTEGHVGGLMGRFARSLMNAFDNAYDENRGYMYYTWLSAYQQLLSEPGWSQSGGSPIAGGPAGTFWRMPLNSWAEKTGVEVSQGRLYFAPSTDGSTVQVTVNGVVATIFTVNNDGLSPAFNLAPLGAYIKPTDKVRFTVTSGSVDVYGFRLIRKGGGGSRGPLVYCSPEGSQGFSDYYNPTRANLLARYVNADQPSAPKLVICLLGTNNIISTVGKQLNPTDYAAAMQTFLTTYRTLLPGCTILFWVPPKPRSDVVLPLGTYDEYVTAANSVVASNTNVGIIRMDLSGVEGTAVYADPDPVPGVHYNSLGHAGASKYLCDYFGISVNNSWPAFKEEEVEPVIPVFTEYPVAAGANWTSFAVTGNVTNAVGGFAGIYGYMEKSTGGGSDFGQVSSGTAPSDDAFFLALDQTGAQRVIKLTASNMTLGLVDVAALPSITRLNFSGQGFRI